MRDARKSVVVLSVLLLAACGRTRMLEATGLRGVPGQTFAVQVFPPTNGVVTSVPAGINCGGGGAACSVLFPWSASVTLTAVAANGYQFNLWAGDCYGAGACVLDTTQYGADKYVVADFIPLSQPRMHPNFSDPTVHAPAYSNETYSCYAAGCHGPTLAGAGIAPACASCHAHSTLVTQGACAQCHAVKMTEWASPADLHSAAAADTIGSTDHDTAELLVNECINCHSMFQRASYTIQQLVTPSGFGADGNPMYCAANYADQNLYISGTTTLCTSANIYAGPWTLTLPDTASTYLPNPPVGAAWEATKCEVCHDPLSDAPAKLAKYGNILDLVNPASITQANPAGDTFFPAYIDLNDPAQATAWGSQLPNNWLSAPYQWVFDATSGAYDLAALPAASDVVGSIKLTANKLCSSCHNPDDQGDPTAADPTYGPQGGDSRAYVTASHRGMTCVDCHLTHDFTPAEPALTSSCSTSACHGGALPAGPGKVHTNHL